jgi:YfiH family protein
MSSRPDPESTRPAVPPRQPLTLPGPSWSGVSSFVTTRQGGVSDVPYTSWNLGDHVGDDPVRVAENRQRLAALLPATPLWLQQVHGTDVVDADGLPEPLHDVPCGDAAITRTPGKVLAIMTADCLPVLLAAEDGSALAMAHAGWRGLAAGVLESTVTAMRREGSGARLRAWIGPAIGPTAFEVGDEVRIAFVATDPGASTCFRPASALHKWMADLPALARRRLHAAGVPKVMLSGYCTVTDADHFFSYRRDGQTGRFATVAWLNPTD